MAEAIESSSEHTLSSDLVRLAKSGLVGLSGDSSNLNTRLALLDVRLMFDYRSDSERGKRRKILLQITCASSTL